MPSQIPSGNGGPGRQDPGRANRGKGSQTRAGATKVQPGGRVTVRSSGPAYRSSGPSISRFKTAMGRGSKGIFILLLGAIVIGSLLFFSGGPQGSGLLGNSTSGTDATVAIVEKEPITRSELVKQVEQRRNFDLMQGMGSGLSMMPELYGQTMQGLIEQQVILAAARKSNLKVSDADYEAEVNKIIDSRMNQAKSSYTSPAAFTEYLKNQGQTEEEYRQTLRDQYNDELQQQGGDARQLITDQLLAQNYVKQQEQMMTLPFLVHYQQIVISSTPKPPAPGAKPPTTAQTQALQKTADAAAKVKADAAMKDLSSGKDFKSVVKTYSTDKSSPDGDAGWVTPSDAASPDYVKRLAGAKPGQIVGPIKSFDGYHIMKVLDTATRLPAKLDPQKDQGLQQAADQAFEKKAKEMADHAAVTYQDPAVEAAFLQLKDAGKADARVLALYRQAASMKTLPADERAWSAYAAGELLKKQSKNADALAMYQAAATTSPSSGDAWEAAGEMEAKLGHKDLAKADFRKALANASGNLMLMYNLYSQFMSLGDRLDAQAAMKRVSDMSRARESAMGASSFSRPSARTTVRPRLRPATSHVITRAARPAAGGPAIQVTPTSVPGTTGRTTPASNARTGAQPTASATLPPISAQPMKPLPAPAGRP